MLPGFRAAQISQKTAIDLDILVLAAVLFLYEHVLERPLTGFIQVGLNIRVGLNHSKESTVMNDAAIARFRANLQGDFIQPTDPRYDEARKVFNGMIDKRPALIVRCAVVADVIAAVNPCS